MRLHRNLVYTTIDALNAIFNEGEYADKVVARSLKKDKRWGSSDRKFVAETIYEIVRWKRLYAEIAEVKEPFDRNNLWRMFSVWAVLRGYPIPDWRQLEGTPERKIKGRFDELSKVRALKESIPDWMDELGVKELGEKVWATEIAAQNQPAKVILRVNTLKTTREALRAILMDLNIETETLKNQPDALVLKERANVFLTDAFKQGFFEVQDANSQLVAAFLDVKPGMRVVDTCAGAGGKTLHIASLMENKGQIIDQKSKPNAAVKYLLNTNGLNVQLREKGFSYDVYETEKIPLSKKDKEFHSSNPNFDNKKAKPHDFALNMLFYCYRFC